MTKKEKEKTYIIIVDGFRYYEELTQTEADLISTLYKDITIQEV